MRCTSPYCIALLCYALLLTACTTGAAPTPADRPPTTAAVAPTATGNAPPTMVAPTRVAPTQVPMATAFAAPTSAPTAPSTALLPQPLYTLRDGQVWRIERDGKTERQVTFEPDPIREFDIHPATNGLVYIAGSAELTGTRSLITLDHGGRTELVTGPVQMPLINPGSDEIAFMLSESVPGLVIGQDDSPTGIWITTHSGGRPSVFLADKPVGESSTSETVVDDHYYTAFSWSPDGTKMLISDYPGYGDGANTGVANGNDRQVVLFDGACCGEANWSSDSASVVQAGGVGVQDALLGLWRVDARTGKATELLPSQIDGRYALITAPHLNDDGSVNVFMTLATEAPELNPAAFGPLIMTRVAPGGTRTPLRPNDTAILNGALWAPDGSGAVGFGGNVYSVPDSALWLPADGSSATRLPLGEQTKWGSNQPVANQRACDNYQPLAWQAPDVRRVESSVAELQGRLAALGYNLGQPDGLYGEQTREVVRAFQQANGLPISGDVDCATWGRLLSTL